MSRTKEKEPLADDTMPPLPGKPLALMNPEPHENGTAENGAAAPPPLGSSSTPAAWEMEEPPKSEAEAATPEDPEDTLTALQREMEKITPEEADEILHHILEYGGRLPFTVKRRGEVAEETLYARLPERGESRDCERMQVALLHRLRTGTKENLFEDRIPTMAEFINDLYETMPAHQREAVDRIQNDVTMAVQMKNIEMLQVFSGSPYFALIQNTAEVLANDRYNSEMASRVVERRGEDGDFARVYANVKIFDEEEIDVSNDIIRAMQTIHQKLQSARFLALSSDAPPDGATNGTSPKSMD